MALEQIKKDIYILGLNPGHNSTAALLKNGKIIACVSEERFSRLKNNIGFPQKAMEYVLNFAGIKAEELDMVVFSGGCLSLTKPGEPYNSYIRAYKEKSFLRKTFGYLAYKYPKLMEPIIKFKHGKDSLYDDSVKDRNSKEFSEYYKVPPNQIRQMDHHEAHAMAACFNLPKDKESLIFTLDGEGDFLCATVNIFNGKTGEFKKIAETEKGSSIGYLYALVTMYLGMKPNQHEFKVMGLAPYAKKYDIDKVYPDFKDILWIDDLQWRSKFRMQYSDSFLFDKMKFQRFDNIAGALQRLTENLTVQWISNAIKKTGIKSIALGGGVFMNVKANQVISELPEVEEIFCIPSAGDESTAIGAYYYGYKKYCEENQTPLIVHPIDDLYLGPEYDEEYVKNLIKSKNLEKNYNISHFKDINSEIARLLASGEIVARCTGRSEWGARALGNRSILANPVHKDTVRVLNQTIKDRDFFMPFTPSIIEEDIDKYSINPKKIKAPYMSITFNSTEQAQKELPAAMHAYDFTIRPQIVYKSWNPDYHDLITKFKQRRKKSILAINILNAGFKFNVIPGRVEAKVDVRPSPEDSLKEIETFFKKHIPKRFKWKKEIWIKPIKKNKDNALIKYLKKITREKRLYMFKGFTEMYYLEKLGIQTLCVGPGDGNLAHVEGEYIIIKNIPKYQKLIEKVMKVELK